MSAGGSPGEPTEGSARVGVGAAPRRRVGRPPAVDSNVTKANILTAARLCFAARGYDATTNRDIATEAGLTSAALYHYTACKADLYAEVFEQVHEIVFQELDAVFDHETFTDRVRAMIAATVELNRRDPSLSGFVITVPPEVQRHPELRDRIEPISARTSGFLGRLVGDAVERDELSPDADPQAVADLIYALLAGFARFSTVYGDAQRLDNLGVAFMQVLSGRLLAAPGPDQ